MTITAPTGVVDLLRRLPAGAPVAVVNDGPHTHIGLAPDEIIRADGTAALQALGELRHGWWAGWLAYDLGRTTEPFDGRNAATNIPDLYLARYDDRVVIGPDGVHATGPEARDLLHREPIDRPPPTLRGWRSSMDDSRYTAAVRTILEHLAAGDCYQVNLTRQLRTDQVSDPVALTLALERHHTAPHRATVVADDLAVVSASPERFLKRSGDAVQTRPIKGTAASLDALVSSVKDRAENVMIVDLARNDLGRVCLPGSVRVDGLCEPERQPGLVHLVSTVSGLLAHDVGWDDLIAATFPPASVTGCPKPRVLEIIESLEDVRRGVYCGAVGWIDADTGRCDLNVAIRTFTIGADGTTFGVGGGIVADSDPVGEWDETELKAAHLLAVAGGLT